MTSSFFKFFYSFAFIIVLFVCIIVPSISNTSSSVYSKYGFVWPLSGYTYISSYFGYRNSPTAGASSYHSGIDIPAPSGTPILAVESGVVTFASWGAGGGYTIVIKNEDLGLSFSYCHVSPIFIVNRNDYIVAGSIISTVGPKNVFGIENNPYKDENRSSYKWCNYWCTFALNNKKRRQCRQSFRLF